jgi:hypothetical protein
MPAIDQAVSPYTSDVQQCCHKSPMFFSVIHPTERPTRWSITYSNIGVKLSVPTTFLPTAGIAVKELFNNDVTIL